MAVCVCVCVSAVGMRRMGSVKARKVSTQSLQSTTSADDPVVLSTFVNFDEAAAPAAVGPDIPCDEGQDTQTDLRDMGDELDYCHNMPWIKVPSYVSHSKKYDVVLYMFFGNFFCVIYIYIYIYIYIWRLYECFSESDFLQFLVLNLISLFVICQISDRSRNCATKNAQSNRRLLKSLKFSSFTGNRDLSVQRRR